MDKLQKHLAIKEADKLAEFDLIKLQKMGVKGAESLAL